RDSTCPRARRAYTAQVTAAIAMIALVRLGPSAPAMAIARMSAGNARKTSVRRMSASATRPPAYPAMRPTIVPSAPASATTTTPMTSEMREPYRMRLSRSRPSWSVPSQCSPDGGWRRDARSCESGSYGASSGAKTAPTTKRPMSASARTFSGSRRIGARVAMKERRRGRATARSATLDPRIEPVVGDVDGQIRERIDDRREEGHAQHRREVEAHCRGGRVAAEAGPAEDRLGEDGAREEAAERESDDRDRRDERVPKAVAEHDDPLAQPLRARGAHVVLPEDLEHARARHARDDRGREVAERERGEREVQQAAAERVQIPRDKAVDDVEAGARWRRRDERVDPAATREPAELVVAEADHDEAEPEDGDRPSGQRQEAHEEVR